MNERMLTNYRLYLAGIITVVIWSMLLWAHFNGGVKSHYLLHRKDMPAISNWWSGLLIPLLSWFLLYRVQKRISKGEKDNIPVSKILKSIYAGIVALCYATLIVIIFINQIASVPGYLLLFILVIAFFYPVYRAECVLGFVLGMTIAFGAFISIAIAGFLLLATVIIYCFVRPATLKLVARILKLKSSAK